MALLAALRREAALSHAAREFLTLCAGSEMPTGTVGRIRYPANEECTRIA